MPELPEVETVRAGLAAWAVGRRDRRDVEVLHPRAIRRHVPGAAHFVRRARRPDDSSTYGAAASTCGCRSTTARRSSPTSACPGQFRLGRRGRSRRDPSAGTDPLRRRRPGAAVRRPTDVRRAVGQSGRCRAARRDRPHRARPDRSAVRRRGVRRRRSGGGTPRSSERCSTRSLISGVGNIYADEALWRAKLHGARPTDAMTKPAVERLLGHVRDVLGEALKAGGTSFDALYVNVNGESGYFDRSLNAYGREGEPCDRCGTPIRRESLHESIVVLVPALPAPAAIRAPGPGAQDRRREGAGQAHGGVAQPQGSVRPSIVRRRLGDGDPVGPRQRAERRRQTAVSTSKTALSARDEGEVVVAVRRREAAGGDGEVGERARPVRRARGVVRTPTFSPIWCAKLGDPPVEGQLVGAVPKPRVGVPTRCRRRRHRIPCSGTA